MQIANQFVACTPFSDQKMGTAGLRRKVTVFQQPHYVASFVQAVLDTLKLPRGATIVLGGDGRFYNEAAIQIIARVLAGNGVGRLIVGQHGLLSTPAASNLIRTRRADGGFLLTASHNPGGPAGDFGIKFNVANGGQAPPGVTDDVYAATTQIRGYQLAALPELDLARCGRQQFGDLAIEIVDPVDAYLDLMQRLFDFDLMAAWLKSGSRIVFDGLHGITGPYARRILCDTLGAAPDCILHAEPLPDFGGLHPDPNPVDAAHLVRQSARADSPALLAASDGDGDRNMILGPGMLVSPGDSVAVLLAQARLAPGYRDGVPGAARSMPTSRALDVVAAALGLPCYETPTGWRYFCNLLDSGRIGLCGEESFGTGSSHAREKDGLWAVLFWINILAARKATIPQVMHEHWQRFGRHYFRRHDYEVSDADRAEAVMQCLRGACAALRGRTIGGTTISLADDFCYSDPVDGSVSSQQGVRIVCADGSRIVYRLSGTGTSGATLRVYLELYERDPARCGRDTDEALAPVARRAAELAQLREKTGLEAPSMVV